MNAVAGVAAFSTLSINKVGTGYTLTASASGLTTATSGAFNVTAGAAAKVVFTAQPTNTTAGAAVSPAVQVTVEDSQNNVVTTATNQITIAIGTNPSSGTLSGTAQVNAVAGVATFSNLSINSAGTGYTLAASATALTGATSNAFNVLVGAAAKLAITTQPTNAAAGAAINPAVQVSVEDSQGNIVTTATNQITVAIGTNPSAGTLSGTAQLNAVAGVATFPTLSINKTGTGYTLTANAATLAGATSSAFNITAGAAAKLAFTAEPVNTVAGSNITPSVSVSVEDALSNVVTTATNQITIAIGTNPSSGTLSGTLVVNAVNGVATFSTLDINNVGTGYTLSASASGLSGASSTAFNIIVSVGPAAKLAFTVQPNNVVAGTSIAPAVQVSIEDAGGNLVTSATTQITIAIGTNPSSGTLSGTLAVNAVNGVATFSTLKYEQSWNRLHAGSQCLGTDWHDQQHFQRNRWRGVEDCHYRAAQQRGRRKSDRAGSPGVHRGRPRQPGDHGDESGDDRHRDQSIEWNIERNGAAECRGGCGDFLHAGHRQDWDRLHAGRQLIGPYIFATSSAFNVSAGAASTLAFTVQPSNVSAGTSIAPSVQVSVEDAQGNVVTTATNQITIAIGTNPSSGTLSGTAQVNAVAGVAIFSSLSIDNTGTGYTLAASASGLTGAVSSAFNVTANCTTNCTISGNVTGSWVSGVTITLSGGPSSPAPAVTDSNGHYSFTALTQGTYTITPSLAGYAYNPSAPAVSIGASTIQDFVVRTPPSLASFSISGTITYAGGHTGQTIIRVYPSGCTGCGALAGTSLPSAPAAGGDFVYCSRPGWRRWRPERQRQLRCFRRNRYAGDRNHERVRPRR